MTTCEVCGNEYDKAFQIVRNGVARTFDSFECAIHAMAPICAHCGNSVIGHGVEVADQTYCCAHCAKSEGKVGPRDRVGPELAVS